MENKSGVLRRAVSSKGLWMAFAFALFLWLNNTSLFTDRSGREPVLVAHRALGQTHDLQGVKWDTNTAAIIHEPAHGFIENTLPAIKAAFEYGATVVEFDVRLTQDRQLAVFHDYTLEYRTDGNGTFLDLVCCTGKLW